MNTQDIYKLASQLTEKEIATVLNNWEASNETGSLEEFHALVRLGDSRALAMATVLDKKAELLN